MTADAEPETETERILITGASGFVGRHLLDVLLESVPGAAAPDAAAPDAAPPEIHALVRTDAAALAALAARYPGRLRCHRGDLLERAAIDQLVAAVAPARVFHLAADTRIGPSWDDPARCLAQNVAGTANLLAALAALAVSGRPARLLLLGSADEHARIEQMPIGPASPLAPASPYGASKASQKLLCDVYARAFGLDVRRAVAFNLIGPGLAASTAIADFARQIALIERGRQPPSICVGNLAARRVWLDVRDAARALLAADRAGRPGGTYVLGTAAEPRPVRDLLELLIGMSARAGAIEIVVDEARYRPLDIPSISGDHEAIRRELGWAPVVPLEASLRDTLDFWRGVVSREPAGEAPP